MILKRQVLLKLAVFLPLFASSQVVFQDLTRTAIYNFLDELAMMKVISIQSATRPYSRLFIAQKLQEAEGKKDLLDNRMQKELAFYLKDYNLELQADLSYLKGKKGLFKNKKNLGIPIDPLSFQYRDPVFVFSLRPIWGIEMIYNERFFNYHRWGGAEIFGYIGKHVGYYASLRDNHEEQMLSSPVYITDEEGAAWKESGQYGGDYSEMRGGVTFSWNWGSAALVKDHFQWGDNYHGSNIFSGRTPSFPYLQLQMTPASWFSFNYVAGWLVSEVIDSSRTYTYQDGKRYYYFGKFLAASMFTFNPWKNLDLSVGNSVVSCSEYFNPAFLSPFLFFVDFTYTGDSTQKAYFGNNSQLFFSAGSRQIRHLHLYATLFIDGFSWKAMTHRDLHNFLSWKAGFRVTDWPLHNLSLTAEYTHTNPMTYQSVASSLSFASNQYNLGSYLRDNSQEIYVALAYKPIRGLTAGASWIYAERGKDEAMSQAEDPYAVPVLTGLTWKENAIGLSVKYEFINNAFVFVEYMNRQNSGDVKYTPPMFVGNTNTLVAGFNVGF
jgi:hypothetical protein